MTTGAIIAGSALAGVAVGTYSAVSQAQANRDALHAQKKSLQQERAEIERQKKKEIEQQKRENEQLMNTVSNLTNTSYSGVSSPSVDYDKYGDLG